MKPPKENEQTLIVKPETQLKSIKTKETVALNGTHVHEANRTGFPGNAIQSKKTMKQFLETETETVPTLL